MKRIWNCCFVLLLVISPVGVLLADEVVEFTQTSCQFIESEQGVDYHFNSSSAAFCKRKNAAMGAQRSRGLTALHLKAGAYVFRVKNRDVPYSLGFWLRGSGLSRLMLPSISGGGIAMGQEHDYSIFLKPGEYRYSCPLNPTPDYILIVE